MQDSNDILVIDVSNSFNYHIKNTKKDFQIVSSYEDGLTILEEKKNDFLIINIDEPTTEVFFLLQHLSTRLQNNNLSALILIEYEDSHLIEKVYQLSGSHIYKKFISSKTLSLMIEQWIESEYKIHQLRNNQHLLQEYKDAVDISNIVSKTDPNGIITFVNNQFCEISGYSKEELIGQAHNIIRHPDMPSDAFEEMWKTIQSKNVWQGIVKNRTKNNGVYYVDTTIKPIINNSGDIIEYIGIRKDITEQENFKQGLEHELSLTTENLQEMFKRSREYHKAMDESTILTRANLEGKITYVNHEFTLALGYKMKDIRGKDHKIMKHPDTPRIIIKNLWDTILQGKTWKGMIQNLDKYGNTVWLDTVIVPIRNMEEEIVEYLTIRHNVSEVVHLHEEIETTQGELIYRLGAAAEARSKETANHIKRVAHYSKLLAQLVGLDEKDAEIIFQASPMHDIGKIAIPDHILNKPGKLTSEEWTIMKTHSEIGYNILSTSNRPILKASSIISHQHHEKYDGTGYPRGLKGKEIHIYGRISAIADVFDALGSDRVYKKAWKLNEIIELFSKERGKHFDPYLMDMFMENLEKFIAISEQFKDTFDEEE